MAMEMATETVGTEMVRAHLAVKAMLIDARARREAAAIGERVTEDCEGFIRVNLLDHANIHNVDVVNRREVIAAWHRRIGELLIGGGER